MNKTIIIIASLILLIIGCRQEAAESRGNEKAVKVKLSHAIPCDYTVPVRASGMLATRKEMKLSFKTGGLIDLVNVHEGEYVQSGQLLARLNLSEISAERQKARTAHEKAIRDLERAENLYRDSVATLEQYQDARSALSMAYAAKQIADFNYQHSFIKAPSTGQIQKILMEEHEMAAPGYPVLLFATTANEWVVRVALTDKDIVRVAVGDSAVISMDPYPDRLFQAIISELGAMADPVTGTYEAELKLQNAGTGFRSGFISRATIYPSDSSQGYSIPMTAIREAGGNRASLYVAKDGRAVKRDVITGPVKGDNIIITSGIEENDMIINDGAAYLSPGTMNNRNRHHKGSQVTKQKQAEKQYRVKPHEQS
ncbi:MAG: efflux RND transporter periplasmic adaptor subunit [Bacteroidales bacterium]|nr:efflux RND transporter periplasmic adaptor subunit [Bacteroidales bacterium]